MSILIKGMEMPRNCWECPCYHHKQDDGYYDYEICLASGTIFNDGYSSVTGHKTHIDPFKARLDNCPLIPVPPHGRLIDADEFLKRAIGTKCFRGDYALMLEELVGESTTIIPTEESRLSATIKCGGAVTCAVAYSEEVYGKYTDTAGNLHWTGTHSGEHIVKAEKGE